MQQEAAEQLPMEILLMVTMEIKPTDLRKLIGTALPLSV
jgi:hypothetical protein